MSIQEVFFWILAVASVASALAMIHFQNIFRAVIMLVVTFLSVAGLFVLLSAEFLAVVQILIYAGAVSILLVFAVLLTRDVEGGNPANRFGVSAAVGASLIFTMFVVVAVLTNWVLIEPMLTGDALERFHEIFSTTPLWLADLLLTQWVLPFEVASLLLLGAAIGALVIVRERGP